MSEKKNLSWAKDQMKQGKILKSCCTHFAIKDDIIFSTNSVDHRDYPNDNIMYLWAEVENAYLESMVDKSFTVTDWEYEYHKDSLVPLYRI